MSSDSVTDKYKPPTAADSTSGVESGDSPSPITPDDPNYPEQRHAGAVGLGPNYAKGADMGEKMTGLKEQAKGKLLRNPDLVEHGRQRKTGELKKQEEADNDDNPFTKH